MQGIGSVLSLWNGRNQSRQINTRPIITLPVRTTDGLVSTINPWWPDVDTHLVAVVDLQVAQKFRVLYIYPLRTEMMADPGVQIHFLRCSSVLCKFYPTEMPDGYISEGYVVTYPKGTSLASAPASIYIYIIQILCVCVGLSSIGGQTAGPIMTKFGTHMRIDLGMVPT